MSLTTCKECNKEISKKATQCPSCGAPIKQPIGIGKIIKILLAIFVGFIVYQCTSIISEKEQKSKEMATKTQSIINKVTISDFSWKTTAFNTVMEANFTINNTNPFPVKDITIKCQHSANSGTVIDSNTHTIYEIIPANTSKTFNDINMGFIQSQASKSACWVTSANK